MGLGSPQLLGLILLLRLRMQRVASPLDSAVEEIQRTLELANVEAALLLLSSLQAELQLTQVRSIPEAEEDLLVEVEFVREHQELLRLANNFLGSILRSPFPALCGPLEYTQQWTGPVWDCTSRKTHSAFA